VFHPVGKKEQLGIYQLVPQQYPSSAIRSSW